MGTSATWIDSQFPLAVGKHQITSKPDDEYNCIAYAAGDKSAWWQHGPGYKWPAANRSPLISSLVAVFTGLGYAACDSDTLESGFEKVALYARNGLWTHAARQLPSGKWTSKLGPDEDIQHESPECLCGDSYGTVHCIMRRAAP